MDRYFDNLDALHHFTLSLDCQPKPIQCRHCSAQYQFVSHGFVYKKQQLGEKRAVGKRIFCSNRHGRSGCGRTIRLYLATELASLHYTAVHMTVFVLALLIGSTIRKAYLAATDTLEPRNAYRWLHKLQCKLLEYRVLGRSLLSTAVSLFRTKSKKRCILLSTLQALFSTIGTCAQYQQQMQATFV